MKVRLIYIAIIILFTSCQSQENDSQNTSSILENYGTAVQENYSFKSYFKSDSTLTNKDSIDVLTISNGAKEEEILAICNCDKNVEENTIKIQISVAIPTKAELEEGATGGRTFMGLGRWPKKAQFRLLTFHLKDSTIKKLNFSTNQLKKYIITLISNIRIFQIIRSVFQNLIIQLPQKYSAIIR